MTSFEAPPKNVRGSSSKGTIYTRTNSGRLVELLSPNGRTLQRIPTSFDSKNSEVSNKLLKSKSDSILKYFKKSPSPKLVDESVIKNSKLPPTPTLPRNRPKAYKAVRSGTGPLIILPHSHQSDQESLAVEKKPNENFDLKQPSSVADEIQSLVKTSESSQIYFDEIKEREKQPLAASINLNKKNIFDKYLPSEPQKKLNKNEPEPEQKLSLETPAELLLIQDQNSITEDDLHTDCKQLNTLNAKSRIRALQAITYIVNAKDKISDQNCNSSTVQKQENNDADRLSSQNKITKRHSFIKHFKPKHFGIEKSFEKADEHSPKLSIDLSEKVRIDSNTQEKVVDKQHSGHNKKGSQDKDFILLTIKKRNISEESSLTLQNEEKSVDDATISVFAESELVDEQFNGFIRKSNNPIDRVSSIQTSVEELIIPKKNICEEEICDRKNSVCQRIESRKKECLVSVKDNFRTQNAIREKQEKKIVELHLKHLHEIHKLRSQNFPNFESSLIDSSSLLSKRKTFSSAVDSSFKSPPPKLVRSVTLDSASDFGINSNGRIPNVKNNREPFETNSLNRKNKLYTSSVSNKEQDHFSFSNYLTQTRKGSIGEKITLPQPKISLDENKNSKVDFPKRVHFPDEKITSTVEIRETLSQNKKGETFAEKVSKKTAKKSSILKHSESVDDSKIEVVENPVETYPISNISISPVKPPRGDKIKRNYYSTLTQNDVMKSKKSDPISLETQNRGKENSVPKTPPHSPTYDSHKRKSHHQEISQSSGPISFKNSEENKDIKTGLGSKPPQPPSRGMKGRSVQNTLAGGNKSRIAPLEGSLVTACKVSEEEQILKLLKELGKITKLDSDIINQLDKSDRTPLSHACSNGFLKVVEFLTSQSSIVLNCADNEGSTPLHYAAQGGHVDVVSHLVNTCSRQIDLDVRNNLGFTPLMKAAIQGRTKIAKVLLFAGASPHLRDYGRGLCASEWARYTGRNICAELIDSVQRSCSNQVKDRWSNDADNKSNHSGSSSSLSHLNDNKDSWLKHKFKKAFNKCESKKEFNVASNLSNLAACASSPILSKDAQTQDEGLPKVQITEVAAPDCYLDPDDCQSLPSPPSSEDLSSEDEYAVTMSDSSAPIICSADVDSSSKANEISKET